MKKYRIINVNIAPKAIPHNTSFRVCQSLSLRTIILASIAKIFLSSALSSLIYWACFHASYLTFIASYQKRKENEIVTANSNESNPCIKPTSIVILHETPLCTEGNQPALQKLVRFNVLSLIISIITFIDWIKAHTNNGTIKGKNQIFILLYSNVSGRFKVLSPNLFRHVKFFHWLTEHECNLRMNRRKTTKDQ